MAENFYIVDVRGSFRANPYITMWRPRDAGYCYPLPWAGQYDKATIDARSGYYHVIRYGTKRTLDRFPVPCAVVERFGIQPASGIVDGDVGPVIPNIPEIRSALQKARYVPGEDGRETIRLANSKGEGA